MNIATENYISEAKDLILKDDLESLEELWYSIAQVILSRSKAISYDLIFRDCYFFSINQRKERVTKWLEDQFKTLSPVIQNKLHQTMTPSADCGASKVTYAKYLKKSK